MLLILLPGMDGTGHLFDPFIKYLPAATQTKIVRYPDQSELSYEQLEEFVLRELPTAGEYVIIAESFSGPIALRLASRNCAGLAAVVLVSSFAYRPLGRMGSLLARLPLNRMFRMPLPDLSLRTYLLGGSASAYDLNRVRYAIGQVQPHVLAGRLRQALTSEYGQQSTETIIPVIAVFAKYDRLLGQSAPIDSESLPARNS